MEINQNKYHKNSVSLSMLKFQNKIALITGSGTGIGKTIAIKIH